MNRRMFLKLVGCLPVLACGVPVPKTTPCLNPYELRVAIYREIVECGDGQYVRGLFEKQYISRAVRYVESQGLVVKKVEKVDMGLQYVSEHDGYRWYYITEVQIHSA